MTQDETLHRIQIAKLAAWRQIAEGVGFLAVAAVLVALAMSAAGCKETITAPPDPPPACPFVLDCSAVAGFPGVYTCAPDPPGPYQASVNGVTRSIEGGAVLVAASGDVVQGCRGCGCSPAVVLR